MPVRVWLLFCATEVVVCLIPGPAVLMVVSQSLSGGPRAGVLATIGIVAANTIYFALSATSLGALLAASSGLFTAIRWVGAAYLIVSGLRMIVIRHAEGSDIGGATPRTSRGGAFAIGALTQGSNPKALVFFTAILPQFISPNQPLVRQVVILGLTSILIEFGVMSAYVATCHRARAWAQRFAVPLQRIGGAFLVGAGARLAVIR